MDGESCGNCRFSTSTEGAMRLCKRHSPVYNDDRSSGYYPWPTAKWPRVEANWWCGDFEYNDSAVEG